MKKILPLCLLVFVLATGCSFAQEPHCDPPRDSFSKADLVGTWIAGTPDQRDTLIIQADGTYKQIIHIEFAELPPIDYQSDWQTWWLEDNDSNVPVLHLEGWRMCGYNPDRSCDTAGGSGSHMCGVTYTDDPNEGALYVMGARELTLTLPLLENSWFYYQPNP